MKFGSGVYVYVPFGFIVIVPCFGKSVVEYPFGLMLLSTSVAEPTTLPFKGVSSLTVGVTLVTTGALLIGPTVIIIVAVEQ